jgi:hypothetical protein
MKARKTMTKQLSAAQVKNLIKAIGGRRTVLVEGEAGSGKTSIHYALKADPAFAGYFAPKPIDCTQLSDGSVWMPDIDRVRGVSCELPNERFGVSEENHKGVEGAKPALICLDEIAKTRQFIKDVLAPIIYERRIGNYEMPEGSVVFGCTNLSEEGLGDTMQAHLRNRLVIVQMRKPTKEEWVRDFAIPRGLNAEVIAAAEMYPMAFESFTDYRTGGAKAGRNLAKDNPYIIDPSAQAQGQVVTPRSLHTASDIVDAKDSMDEETLQCALSGALGDAFAANIMTMIRFGQQLPTFERVMADPGGTAIPQNVMAGMVQVFQFIKQVRDREQAEAASVYVGRMKEELKSLFVNNICNSSVLDKFGLSKTFAQLLAANRQYLGA